MHTSAGDDAEWIRAEAGKLLAFEGLESVTVTELRTAVRALPHVCDWLIEIELVAGTDPAALVENRAFTDFVAELRSLRLHPTAAVADPATAVSFSRADSR
jgi:hypothetical protein